jgi:hypothetical protein
MDRWPMDVEGAATTDAGDKGGAAPDANVALAGDALPSDELELALAAC